MSGGILCGEISVGTTRLARSKLVSVIEVRLGSTTRQFECLFSFVTNHHGVTAGFTVGFAAATIRGHNTPADKHYQD
jgi:hypothetical protein